MIFTPHLALLAAIAAAAAFTTGAYLGHNYARNACKAAEADRRALVAEIRTANLQLADGIASRTEVALGNIRVQNTTINREVRHEREIHTRVLENPDCAIPASTVGVLNRARGYPDDRPPAGEPARIVPASTEAAEPSAPAR